MRDISRLASKEFFLFLLPLFFVLHGSTENFPLVSFADALELTGIYILVTLGLLGISFLIFPSFRKAAFFTFFLVSFHLFFGPVHDFLKEIAPGFFISKYSFILPASLLTFVWLFFFLLRTKANLQRAVSYLNIVFLILLFVDAFVLAIKLSKHAKTTVTYSKRVELKRKPNIYLIIADEYAGRKELKELFNYNNEGFEDSLKQRGFQIVKFPSSNYNYTPYSMASLFDMNFIKGVSTSSSDFNNRKIVFEKINNNRVVSLFKEFGYKFVNQSFFDFAGIPPDRNASGFHLTGKRIISSQTLLNRLKRDLWYHVIIDLNWNWAKKDYLETLKGDINSRYHETIKIASKKSEEPLFVYTHFIMPHYPYLYNENGVEISFEESMKNDPALYLSYLKYSNKLYTKLIDEIIKADRTNPIIIFMSDHGYNKYNNSIDPSYNFNNIINVYNSSVIPDSITNVNLFRIVLNRNFEMNMPLLKDSTIFLTE